MDDTDQRTWGNQFQKIREAFWSENTEMDAVLRRYICSGKTTTSCRNDLPALNAGKVIL